MTSLKVNAQLIPSCGNDESELKSTVQEAVAIINRLRMKATKQAGAAQDSTEIIRAFRDNIDDELLNDDYFFPR